MDSSGFAKKKNTRSKPNGSKKRTETFIRYFGENEAVDVLSAMRNRKPKDPIEVLRPKVDKFGTKHRGAKWISEQGYERNPKDLGKGRKYTLIMETKEGTKDWLQSNSTKDTKGVQNRNKVIVKDVEIGSYGVGSELLDEYNSRVESATLVDENGTEVETCKKS